jgi:hypothetical protein
MIKTAKTRTWENEQYRELVMKMLMRRGERFTIDGCQLIFEAQHVYILRAFRRDMSFIIVYNAKDVTETYFKAGLEKYMNQISEFFRTFVKNYFAERIMMVSAIDMGSYNAFALEKWKTHQEIEIISKLSRESSQETSK